VAHAPDVLPVLSRGKHRSLRRGACFMELASYLAGERWSDHPSCTHPLLAEVARNVNDRSSDEARPQLAVLIPEVIGLAGDDRRIEARIALHCVLTALPIAPFERQKALAVALMTSRRVLAALDDLPYALDLRVTRALEAAPHATAWAERFAARAGGESVTRFRRHAAHDIVRLAASSAEQAPPAERDEVLRRMLEGAIAACRSLQPAVEPVAVDDARWREACALTG
jgi:hypothetical protein